MSLIWRFLFLSRRGHCSVCGGGWKWLILESSGHSPQTGQQPDSTGQEETVGGQGKGGRGEQGSWHWKTALCLLEELQGWMCLQVIPNVPSPPCQSLSHNLFQELLASKPMFPPSLDCEFQERTHCVLLIFYSSSTHIPCLALWRLPVDVCWASDSSGAETVLKASRERRLTALALFCGMGC